MRFSRTVRLGKIRRPSGQWATPALTMFSTAVPTMLSPFQEINTSILRIQHSRISACERTRPLFFGRGAVGGAPHHQGDLPADVVDAQAAACGVPEHGPVH